MEKACNAIERAAQTIAQRSLAGPDSPVLLMVSGGSDSTALAYIASELSQRGDIGQVGVLHVNHSLRGEASDADAEFVTHLADMLGLPLYLYTVDVARIVDETGDNLEAVARRERYGAAFDALEKLCLYAGRPLSEGRIFTAHTRNDRVENFYMRSIVGTGPGGFRSMLYRNGAVARPLLDTERDQLREFISLRAMGGEAGGTAVCRDGEGALWREDATNAHTDQFRGYVRHKVIPPAQERNPRLLEVLCRTMNLIADEDDMLDGMAQDIVDECASWIGTEGDRPCGCVIAPAFGRRPVPLQRRALVIMLKRILGDDTRIETRSVEEAIAAFEGGFPVSGFAGNIQGDLALSANKLGLRIEPMAAYRSRRKGQRGNTCE